MACAACGMRYPGARTPYLPDVLFRRISIATLYYVAVTNRRIVRRVQAGRRQSAFPIAHPPVELIGTPQGSTSSFRGPPPPPARCSLRPGVDGVCNRPCKGACVRVCCPHRAQPTSRARAATHPAAHRRPALGLDCEAALAPRPRRRPGRGLQVAAPPVAASVARSPVTGWQRASVRSLCAPSLLAPFAPVW